MWAKVSNRIGIGPRLRPLRKRSFVERAELALSNGSDAAQSCCETLSIRNRFVQRCSSVPSILRHQCRDCCTVARVLNPVFLSITSRTPKRETTGGRNARGKGDRLRKENRRQVKWQGLIGLKTNRLTDVGPIVSDCQLRCDPGVRCSRLIRHCWKYYTESQRCNKSHFNGRIEVLPSLAFHGS